MAVKNTRKLRGLVVYSYLEDQALYFIAFEKNAAFSTILRKGYHLSMKGIRMCYLFWQKWYCWFSVSRLSKLIEVKIKTVQWKKSRICKEMKGGKYEKNLAKIQDREMFHIRDIRRNVLPKFTEICMETPCWCPTGWAQFGGRKPKKRLSPRMFCYKTLNLSLEKLIKHQSNILLIHELLG